jgi:hypothetical protein
VAVGSDSDAPGTQFVGSPAWASPESCRGAMLAMTVTGKTNLEREVLPGRVQEHHVWDENNLQGNVMLAAVTQPRGLQETAKVRRGTARSSLLNVRSQVVSIRGTSE